MFDGLGALIILITMHLRFAFSLIWAAAIAALEPQNQYGLLLSKPETTVGTQEYIGEPSMVNIKLSRCTLLSNTY